MPRRPCSRYEDVLIGDSGINILTGLAGNDFHRGVGASDTLIGGDGNDKLAVTNAQTLVDGGDGQDRLLLLEPDTFTFTDASFKSIETIYVRGALTLDLSGVTASTTVNLQNAKDTFATVSGTKGNDVIRAGVGDTVIDGGTGNDKLYAARGADTFIFEMNFGKDNVYGFAKGFDHFDVSALVSSFEDINLTMLNRGADTLVTFDDVALVNSIILRNFAKESLSGADFGLLI